MLAATALVALVSHAANVPPGSSVAPDDDDYEMEQRKPLILAGKGHLNVEELRHVDLDMDISQLSLAELRVVRNALAASKGHVFTSKDLRSMFGTTTWYDQLMMERNEKIEETMAADSEEADYDDYLDYYTKFADKHVPLKYTQAELRFVERVKAREAELLKQNFKAKAGERVNPDNILNPWQIEEMPKSLRDMLARNGFAIVPNDGVQLFHAYEENNYHVFPNFVTTDVYLQLFHFYFDCLLRDIEEERLSVLIGQLCQAIGADVDKIAAAPKNAQMGAAAEWLQAYVAVARALLTGEAPKGVPARYATDVAEEIDKSTKAELALSPFLGYDDVFFPYPLFRPRGHYTHSEPLKRYFRAMMWLQTAPFSTEDINEMRRAALLAHVVGNNPVTKKLYQQVTEPITFLMGMPDNVSVLQVYEEIRYAGLQIDRLLASESDMIQLAKRIVTVAQNQTRIVPKYAVTAKFKVNLMPQRYMPDAEVLQEMADTDTKPRTLRKLPKALDLMAAMGVSSAEKILLQELREAERWPQYTDALAQMKERMAAIDWKASVANYWIDAVHEVPSVPDGAPYFMQTHEWQKKSLNTALASYAELKHDAILYAKQPFGAECGGGGPPEPVIKGYVEPSLAFWKKAVELNKTYEQVLRRFELMTEKAESASESVSSLAQFLLDVSEKELAGKPLSNAEHNQIEIIGSNIEYISLQLAQQKDNFLASWDDVTGADRKVACIADVYTANSFNIPSPEHAVLYEAVGPAYDIYVIVEIEGQLWLTRGAVFSYRELERPSTDSRLTDEEWQEHLETNPTDGTPTWMKDITVPLKNTPEPNAQVLYSTGC